KIADSAAEGVQMVSEKAFATEAADVQQLEVAPEHVGEEGEAGVVGEVHESAGIAAASTEELVDDDTVDLAAVLGGNIRKAPAAASEEEVEPEPVHAATGA
ncbi:MAG TPA: 30S ribosomal protein S2, partial [Acidobacteriaceae bacterium]|nr:30S ribosomal protein S2 [Acidobacteriaceae bacterium]